MSFQFPEDYQHEMGIFALARSRRWSEILSPLCGSPIEILFGTQIAVTVEETGGSVSVLSNENDEVITDLYLWPQKQIGRHRVDFLIGNKDNRMIVECDGRDFHHATREQIERDRTRDKELQEAGYKVARYPGTQLYHEPWTAALEVLIDIKHHQSLSWFKAYMRHLR